MSPRPDPALPVRGGFLFPEVGKNTPAHRRRGRRAVIVRDALDFARADERIPFVTFLLPPSRRHLRGLVRLGARFVDEVEYEGARFRKYRLDTQ